MLKEENGTQRVLNKTPVGLRCSPWFIEFIGIIEFIEFIESL